VHLRNHCRQIVCFRISSLSNVVGFRPSSCYYFANPRLRSSPNQAKGPTIERSQGQIPALDFLMKSLRSAWRFSRVSGETAEPVSILRL
jgi:hypothetical protein